MDDYPDFPSWGTRAFLVYDGDDDCRKTVVIAGLTLTGGKSLAAGGAILNDEDLTVRDSLITGNVTHANFNGYDVTVPSEFSNNGHGGGIASSGSLRLIRTTVTDNLAGVNTFEMADDGVTDPTHYLQNASGGGVYSKIGFGEELFVEDSLISGNKLGDNGAGIYVSTEAVGVGSDPKVTIVGSEIDDNQTFYSGGGIAITNSWVGHVSILDTSVTNNRANAGTAGIAIADGGGTVLLDGVTVDGNNSSWWRNDGSPGGGAGGIHVSANGKTIIRNSTVSNNRALSGGGLLVFVGTNGEFEMENTTVSGNLAEQFGGMLLTGFSSSASAVIRNSTITDNLVRVFDDTEFAGYDPGHPMARGDVSSFGVGVGIGGLGLLSPGEVGLSIENTIIAANHQVFSGSVLYAGVVQDVDEIGPMGTPIDAPDIYYPWPEDIGVFQYNLVGDSTGSGLTPALPDSNGNYIGGAGVNIINPQLGPLKYNGGLTRTHALLGGYAVDGGDPLFVGPPDYDQRGFGYNRKIGSRIDIGAFEKGAGGGGGNGTQALVVTTLDDELDPGDPLLYDRNDLSLREALKIASVVAGKDTITFDPVLFANGSAVMQLMAGAFIRGFGEVTIIGPGADLLTIRGNGQYRVFHIGSLQEFDLSGVTITNAYATEGGAIFSLGHTTLSEVVIEGNQAAAYGGGVYHVRGTFKIEKSTIRDNLAANGGGIAVDDGAGTLSITIDSSTINGNSASSSGGGIYVSSNATSGLQIINTTISGNMASSVGGMIVNGGSGSGPITLSNVTVTENSASNNTGGIKVSSVQTTLHNTIASGNKLNGSPSDLFGTFDSSSSYNLIGTLASGSFPSGLGNQFSNDPELGELRDNGGPTWTHALLTGSLATDMGNPSQVAGLNGVPLFDQRGLSYDRVTNGRIDVGAFERQNKPCGMGSGGMSLSSLDSTPSAYGQIAESSVSNSAVVYLPRHSVTPLNPPTIATVDPNDLLLELVVASADELIDSPAEMEDAEGLFTEHTNVTSLEESFDEVFAELGELVA